MASSPTPASTNQAATTSNISGFLQPHCGRAPAPMLNVFLLQVESTVGFCFDLHSCAPSPFPFLFKPGIRIHFTPRISIEQQH
jgi:hypothetical protein